MTNTPNDPHLSVNTLEVRELRLVNSKGELRATMACSASGTGDELTVFQMFDEAGTPRIELQVSEEGCVVRLNTLGDSQGVSIGASNNRGNGLSINRDDNRPAITMGVSHPDSGDPRGEYAELTIHDDDGNQKSWPI